jgi:flavin-dependent thymidylate synthase
MNNENKVEILGHYGGDLTHSLSAWTSTTRDLTQDKLERIPKLLEMLADNKHGTPFEKSCIHFLVTVDQASHIHLLKHRIGVSINGESARYKELQEDKFYLPKDWKNIKVSSHLLDFEYVMEESSDWKDVLEEYTKLGNFLYHKSLQDLTPVLGKARAKESARYFKTYNSQIDLDVMFNFRSFIHFYFLRSHGTAQLEIQNIANEMLKQIKNIEGNPFKHSLEAFGL